VAADRARVTMNDGSADVNARCWDLGVSVVNHLCRVACHGEVSD